MNEKEFKELKKELEKEYGTGSIMNLNEKTNKHDSISTGSLLLDEALGVGGYPKGRIIEIYGPESSGKTTLALHAIAEVQNNGGTAAFVDAEHAIDVNFAEKLGVNLKKLIISQPDSGEQALEIVDHLVNSGKIDIIVIDSVAALVPLAELNGTMEDQTIGAQARLMSKSLRKLSGSSSKNKTTLLFINQIREKVGVIFGSPEVTPGGRALKFFSTIRLDIRLKERINEDNKQIGQRVKIKVVKNKVAPPYKIIETEIFYDHGIDKDSEFLDFASNEEVIEKAGPWYSFEGEKLGRGKKETIKFLKENVNLKKEIMKKINLKRETKDT